MLIIIRLGVIILNVIILRVIMLSGIMERHMPSAIILIVVAPFDIIFFFPLFMILLGYILEWDR